MRGMAYGHVTELQRLFPEARFVEFGPAFGRIRRVRSEEELAYFRRSGYLTDLACEALEEHLRPGLTEQDILSIVYSAYIKNGGDPGIHFIATTRMDQPDRFVPWQKTTPRVIEAGSVVITELTVSYWGYSTQIHRPFASRTAAVAALSQTLRHSFGVLRKYPQDLQARNHQRGTDRCKLGHRRQRVCQLRQCFPWRSRKITRARHPLCSASSRALDPCREHGPHHPAQSDYPRSQSRPASRRRRYRQTGRR